MENGLSNCTYEMDHTQLLLVQKDYDLSYLQAYHLPSRPCKRILDVGVTGERDKRQKLQ